MTMTSISRSDRLRRVVIVCTNFMRNLAYYRAGWKQPTGWSDPPLAAVADFTRTANGNFIDVCVMEWCKLFGDSATARNPDQHSWRRVVSDGHGFERELLREVSKTSKQFDAYQETMRSYRDKFLAHLDSERTMHIPDLECAELSIRFYHRYLVLNEATAEDLKGLVDTVSKLNSGYAKCQRIGAQAYKALTA